MDKQRILAYWQAFFADLFVGTFKRFFLFSLAGLLLGGLGWFGFDLWVLEPADGPGWVENLIGIALLFWYAGFGLIHGWISGLVHIVSRKLRQTVSGLHDLLDLMTREVIGQFPRFSKNIPKEELAVKFENTGQDLKNRMRLKGGLAGWMGSWVFGAILKGLKFLFLDDVVEELRKTPSDQLTGRHIEHAVRRVGVEVVLSPITDNLFLLHVLNGVLLILTFGIPFGILFFL